MNAISTNSKANRPIAIWLLLGVGMIIIQIALGGITRLTGSGLSITEWNVVTGTLPPSTEAKWQKEYIKYQQTPQYRLLNFDFKLADFKYIFFWEWFHRFWARLMGLVFAVGFVYFLLKRRFTAIMIQPLITLFVLGALQGAVGWIMVASGLEGDAIYVKPTRLALHFIFAMGLLCYTFWFAMALLIDKSETIQHPKLPRFNTALLSLLVIQLLYGALMAGHKAATAAPTWPTINGEAIPSNLFSHQPFWINWIDNTTLIHFVHRNLAYLLTLLIAVYTFHLLRIKGKKLFSRIKWLPLLLVIAQVLLGVFSILKSNKIVPNQWGSFEWLAQIHQLTGMLLLLSLVLLQYVVKRNKI